MHPFATIGSMKCDVDGGARSVGRNGALIECDRDVRIAQQAGRNATICQFMLQLAGEHQYYILLRQRRADGGTDFGAAVGGVNQHKETRSRRSFWRLSR